MKAKCSCGHVFEVTPDQEGTKFNCPACGRKVRMPASRKPAEKPKPKGKAEARDWKKGFALEGEAKGAAEREEPPTPPEPLNVGKQDLAFDSGEFALDAGAKPSQEEEGPIEIGGDQIMDIREGPAAGPPAAPAASGAPAGVPTGEIQLCPRCGRVLEARVVACPECGTLVRRAVEAAAKGGAGKAAAKGAAAWAGTYAGEFGYAYAAVFAGGGWKSWLAYVLGGVIAPVLVILLAHVPILGCVACCAFPIAIIIALGAIVGGMYHFMGHSASSGLAPMQGAAPRIWDDMVVPFLLVICSSNLLVIGPMIAGFVISKFTGSLDYGQLIEAGRGAAGTQEYAKLLGMVASAGLVVAGVLIGILCFPMQLMLLGASHSLMKTANPVSMIKALAKAPLHYAGLCAFFMVNLAITPIMIVLAVTLVAPAAQGVGLLGGLFVFLVIMAVTVYMAAVNGWRLGMFLYDNQSVFDHVK